DIIFYFSLVPTTVLYTLSLHDALPIWKENDCRARAGAMSERDLPPVGHWVKLRLSHSGQMATTFRENKRQRFWAKRAISSSSCRSEEHTSELQSREKLVCRLLLEKKNI